MMAKLFALTLFFVICFGGALGQPIPIQRCFESPPSWSGFIFAVDYAQGMSDRGYLYYNRTEFRMLYSYESRIGTPDYQKHWFFYNTRKSYKYDVEQGTCTVEDIPPDEIIPLFAAMRGSEFRHQDRLGSYIYNLGVTTDHFRMNTDDGGTYRGYYAPEYTSVARDLLCVPVIESFENIDTVPSHQRNRHITFMNITTDPIPPYVWEIPPACREKD